MKEKIMKHCNCDYWKEGLRCVNSCISISDMHGFGYKGKIFDFCPWCGQKLEDVEDIKEGY
jgi:hypothetical protein